MGSGLAESGQLGMRSTVTLDLPPEASRDPESNKFNQFRRLISTECRIFCWECKRRFTLR
jgi:hypothetical protein